MYKCGVYLRTSKNVIDENNSLIMQENIINKYVEDSEDLEIIQMYKDDGYSGLNYVRPEFTRLMKDIETGVIDCVIVKDLSRLGRDYIQTGIYIQYIFPSKGVRLIAINDRYDSISATDIDRYFMIPLRNYINDAYSRDISMKVRSSLYMKMKKGECVVSKVPYGYIKKDGEYIVVDELRDIIRSIYKYCLEGYSLQGIASRLNEQKIVTPYGYRYLVKDGYTTSFVDKELEDIEFYWYPMMVKRILTDKVYIGALVQGKVEKYSYKIKKRYYKDEGMWYCTYRHHEKIIDEKVFFVVNNILKLDIRKKKNEKKCSDYSGVVRCGHCNKGLYHKLNQYICRECIGSFYDIEDGNILIISNRKIGIIIEELDLIINKIIRLIDKVDIIDDTKESVCKRERIVMNIKELRIYNKYIGVDIYNE